MAVKVLSAAELAHNRAFQQGLNRAAKAEDRINNNYARHDVKNTQRDSRHGGNGTNGYNADFPPLKPSIARKGEIKYHAANEKKMREQAAQESDDDDWGYIGEENGEAAGHDKSSDGQATTAANASDPSGNAAPQNSQRNKDPDYIPPHKRMVDKHAPTGACGKIDKDGTEDDVLLLRAERDKKAPPPPPPQRLMARMKLLDAYDDDAQGGVPLI